jgi:hypothetical protein
MSKTMISPQLMKAIREQVNTEMEWLCLATQLSNPIEQRFCYERALFINPNSAIAKTKLAALLPEPLPAPMLLARLLQI